MRKRSLVINIIFLLWLPIISCAKKKVHFEKALSINISDYLNNGVCESCLFLIQQNKELEDYVYFRIINKPTIFRYDIKSQSISETINIALDSQYNIEPFYIDNNEQIYSLSQQNDYRNLLVLQNDRSNKKYSFKNIKVGADDKNVPNLIWGGFVGEKEKIYLNILRRYNDSTELNYFEDLAKAPIISRFIVQNDKLISTSIKFHNPNPNLDKSRLVSNYFLFDIDENKGLCYFQNYCSDTMYVYDVEKNQTKEIMPKGSNYKIIPIWYNPDITEIEDVQLKQNKIKKFYVNFSKKLIYRLVTINQTDSAKKLLQVLDFKGNVLDEKSLSANYKSLTKIGSEVYIYSINNSYFELYTIKLD